MHNRGIFNAEVVHGLQVKCVREGVRQPTTEALEECRGCARLTGKRRKRRSATAHNRGIFNAEVVQGLQVKGIREVGVSPQPKPSKSAEIVQGLQVKAERERGRQPHRKALKKCRGCVWLTGKRRQRRRASATPFSHSFHIFPLSAIN